MSTEVEPLISFAFKSYTCSILPKGVSIPVTAKLSEEALTSPRISNFVVVGMMFSDFLNNIDKRGDLKDEAKNLNAKEAVNLLQQRLNKVFGEEEGK